MLLSPRNFHELRNSVSGTGSSYQIFIAYYVTNSKGAWRETRQRKAGRGEERLSRSPSVTGRDRAETPRDRETGRLSGHDEMGEQACSPVSAGFYPPKQPPSILPIGPTNCPLSAQRLQAGGSAQVHGSLKLPACPPMPG